MTKKTKLHTVLKNCETLADKVFLENHPGIVDFAVFIHDQAEIGYKYKGKYELFDKLGVNNINDYLVLIQQGRPEAVKSYERIKELLAL